jgi:hypothetical protein
MKDAWKNYLLYVISKPLKCLAEKDFETFKIYKPNSNPQSLNKIGYLECFARIFSSISPWLSHEVNPILDDVLKCFEHTLPYFDDLDLFSVRQSLVECGYICYGFLISPFWNKLSDSAKENLIKYVKKTRLLNSEPWQYKMNWLLFHMIIEVFLKSIGSDYDNTFYPICDALRDNDIEFVQVKGAIKTREKNLDAFREGDIPVIFLNSTTDGSGINLTESSDIILCHQMDKSTEKQIIGRALRIKEGKKYGYIILPLIYDDELNQTNI